ncbi:MAG: serine/threonine protein kinase [Bacteroidetes bacterium]|nr:serine/threonine protein kinase [Bacteroidota bacterium]
MKTPPLTPVICTAVRYANKAMIGEVISHYRILDKLGEGGMGVVYRAEDLRLKRDVALKFLPPELTSDPEARNRFIEEAQTASALDHPNIGVIHEIDETNDGRSFICMALYDGETLKQRIERGPLGVQEAVRIGLQVADGLSRAHEAGIIHRDIKPANLIITRDGLVKIVDFGLAKLTGNVVQTTARSRPGTAAYMSPEQIQNGVVDARSDLFSLGVVLYEMVTGTRPFAAGHEAALFYSIVYDNPTSSSRSPPRDSGSPGRYNHAAASKEPGQEIWHSS